MNNLEREQYIVQLAAGALAGLCGAKGNDLNIQIRSLCTIEKVEGQIATQAAIIATQTLDELIHGVEELNPKDE